MWATVQVGRECVCLGNGVLKTHIPCQLEPVYRTLKIILDIKEIFYINFGPSDMQYNEENRYTKGNRGGLPSGITICLRIIM